MSTLNSLTPRETVSKLNEYIIGQDEAKRSVAIALRNRWRRQQVDESLRNEIAPKNIIMIGPTGVGKTEIARRLANLAQSPFLKVEASKFTEVGYVGRDVESMIRDLTELAVNMIKKEERQEVEKKAAQQAEDRLLDMLLPSSSTTVPARAPIILGQGDASTPADSGESSLRQELSTRDKFREMLRSGKLDEREIEISVEQGQQMPIVEVFSNAGMEDMEANLRDTIGRMFPRKSRDRKVKVPEALELLKNDEIEKLIDMDRVIEKAIRRAEDTGIIFLDEIDKIASRDGVSHGAEVSREGVQRDLLPIVEGATVTTRYGMVKTDHILFIASGAFHLSKPSDLVPELQGRFPIRVELAALGEEEFYKILTEPQNALTKQYIALLGTEGVTLSFSDDSLREMARLAVEVNMKMENIGARRLHTILERVLEKLSFEATDLGESEVSIDAEYVRRQLTDIAEDVDLSRFIL